MIIDCPGYAPMGYLQGFVSQPQRATESDFIKYVQQLIEHGEFVDVKKLVQNFPYIEEGWATYRDLKEGNRKINASIDAYEKSTHVLIFRELESSLVKMFNAYKQTHKHGNPYIRFVDLGFGYLEAHEKVIRIFHLVPPDNVIPVTQPSSQEVIGCAMDFFRNVGYGHIDFYDPEIQSGFKQFLFHRLAPMYGGNCLSGLAYSLRDLFFASRQYSDLYQKQVATAQTDLLKAYLAALETSIRDAVSLKTEESADDAEAGDRSAALHYFGTAMAREALLACKATKKTLRESFKFLTMGGGSFSHLVMSFMRHHGVRSVQGSTIAFTMDESITLSEFNEIFLSLVSAASAPRSTGTSGIFLTNTTFLADCKACVLVAWTYFLAKRKDVNQSGGSPQSQNMPPGIFQAGSLSPNSSVQEFFGRIEDGITSDIPEPLLEQLLCLFRSLQTTKQSVSISASAKMAITKAAAKKPGKGLPVHGFSAKLEWGTILDRLRKLLPDELRFIDFEGDKCYRVDFVLYTQLLVAMVITSRLVSSASTLTVPKPLGQAFQDEFTQLLVDDIEFNAAMSQCLTSRQSSRPLTERQECLTKAVVYLSMLQHKMQANLGIPVFECANQGSFLLFLALHEGSHVLEKILEKSGYDALVGLSSSRPALKDEAPPLSKEPEMVPMLDVDYLTKELVLLLQQNAVDTVTTADFIAALSNAERSLLASLGNGDSDFRALAGTTFIDFLSAAISNEVSTSSQELRFWLRNVLPASSHAPEAMHSASGEALLHLREELKRIVLELLPIEVIQFAATRLLRQGKALLDGISVAHFTMSRLLAAPSLLSPAVLELLTASLDDRLCLEDQSPRTRSHSSALVWLPEFAITDASNPMVSTSCDTYMELRDSLRSALVAAPFGVSCREFVMWDALFKKEFEMTPEMPRSLVHFVVQNESWLSKNSPDSVFLVISSDDCCRLPLGAPSLEEFEACLRKKSFRQAGSWMVASRLNLFRSGDKQTFLSTVLRPVFLRIYELCTVDALMDMIAEIMLATVSSLIHLVLELGLSCLAYVSELSMDYVEEMLVSHCAQDSKPRQYLCALLQAASLDKLKFPGISASKSKLMKSASGQALLWGERSVKAATAHETVPGSDSSETASRAVGESNAIEAPAKNGSEIAPSNVALSCDTASSDQEAIVNRFLVTDFHYDATTGKRPDKDTPERKNVQNALEHLSVSLYSSDVHFVLELIQNADDNAYPSGEMPTLKVQLFPHAVLVYNNEIGFSEDNIKAICRVGGSTKKGQRGYIGQKGIGFKSVFTVSDFPEVHSSGYHIKFDREEYMIEPIWIKESEEVKWPRMVDGSGQHFNTCFRLNLDQKTMKNFRKLTKNLEDAFDVQLLLFLNKLQQTIFDNRCSESYVAHQRRELGHHWLQLTSHDSSGLTHSSVWFRRKLEFNPGIKRTKETPVVVHTEVSVAIKFKHLQGNNTSALQPDQTQLPEIGLDIVDQNLPIYAYLPTRTCVFPVIIQGDFLLATNRESLLEDSEWNQILLSKLPVLYSSMIAELANYCNNGDCSATATAPTETPYLTELEAFSLNLKLSDVLRLLPRVTDLKSHDVFDFFAREVFRDLSQSPFLLSSSLVPCKPCELVYIHGMDLFGVTVSQVLPEDLLFKSSGFRYFAAEVQLDRMHAQLLGMQMLDAQLIFSVLEYISSREQDEFPGEKGRLRCIVGLLLLAAKLSGHASPAVPSLKRSISNQARRMIVNHASSPRGRQEMTKPPADLSLTQTNQLRNMEIWPFQDYKSPSFQFCSLKHKILFIEQGTFLSKPQQETLDVFRHLAPFLSNELFNLAKSIAGEEAGEYLKGFLLHKLRPLSYKDGESLGGIQALSCETVVRNIIKPAYDAYSESDPSAIECAQSASTCTSLLPRTQAAAMLVFLYLSDGLKWIDCVCIPVVEARDHNSELVWNNPKNIKLLTNGTSDRSIPTTHFGVEFLKSASSALLGIPISSALRQIGWQVVDPLVSAFAHDRCLCTELEKIPLSSRAIQDIFRPMLTNKSSFSSSFENLSSFLGRVGVVNLFRLDSSANGVASAPELFALLDQLLSNSQPLRTRDLGDFVENRESGPSDLNPKPSGVPLFLPVADIEPRTCSSDVYRSISALVPLIVGEIEALKKSNKSIEAVVNHLCSFAWFPAELHSAIASKYCVSTVVAAPGSLIFEVDAHRAIQRSVSGGSSYRSNSYSHIRQNQSPRAPSQSWPLGPHCLHVPRFASLDGERLKAFFQFYSVNVTGGRDETLLIDQLVWMSSCQSEIVSSLDYMSNLYRQLFSYVGNPVTKWQPHWRQLLKLLEEDKPIIWCPNQLEERQTSSLMAGRMFPLSLVAKLDTTQYHRFSLPISPVKLLSAVYPSCTLIFARDRFCDVCKANEGMLGTLGMDFTFLGSRDIGNQVCYCIESSLATYTARGKSLVHETPTLKHRVLLLSALKCTFDSSASWKLHWEEYRGLLLSTSIDIWKCFHVFGSLAPWNAAALADLRQEFRNHEFLPVMARDTDKSKPSRLVSCFGKDGEILLAVDDRATFELFSSELQSLNDELILIDCFMDDILVNSVLTEPDSLDVYDLSAFAINTTKLLSLPRNEFFAAVKTIRSELFYAPQNLIALCQFLGISTLSSFTKTELTFREWRYGGPTTSRNVVDVMQLANCMLRIAESFVRSQLGDDYVHALTVQPKVAGFLKLKVVYCESIERRQSLKVGNETVTKTSYPLYHWNAIESTLSVVYTIGAETVSAVLRSIIVGIFGLEIKLLAKNQMLAEIERMTRLLSKKPSLLLNPEQLLDYEDIAIDGETIFLWVLHNSKDEDDGGSYVIVDEKPVTATGEAKEAVAGLERLAQEAAERRKTVVHAKAKTVDNSVAATLADSEERQAILARQILGATATADAVSPQAQQSITAAQHQPSSFAEAVTIVRDSQASTQTVSEKVIAVDENGQLVQSTTITTENAPTVSPTVSFGQDSMPPGLLPPSSTSTPTLTRTTPSGSVANQYSISPNFTRGSGTVVSHWCTTAISADPSLFTVQASPMSDITDKSPSTVPSHLDASHNAAAGRFGEQMGYQLISKLEATVGHSVRWVNQESESFCPFDVEIVDSHGNVVRQIEIKTRILRGEEDGRRNQWFISPKEMEYSLKMLNKYCCLLMKFCIEPALDPSSPPPTTRLEYRFVGLENGLFQSLLDREAELVIQLS